MTLAESAWTSATIYDAISREAHEDAIGAIVRDQEAAGLDIICDGRVNVGDSPYGQILYHYVERMTGYKLPGPPIYSTLFAPTCVGEVTREHPFHLATLRATRKATKKPIKISYTGIQVIAAATNNQYYSETKELAMAIAKAFNEDFKELADNGCDIIQLDEFVWPYGMGDWEIEVLNAAVEGAGCQFWVHTCWGNYSGTPGYFPDEEEREFGAWGLERRPATAPAPARAQGIFPQVLDANIDVKSTVTETAEEVADRIRQVLEYVPAERLGLSTDCGLINLPRMLAASKLRALADAARIETSAQHRPTTGHSCDVLRAMARKTYCRMPPLR